MTQAEAGPFENRLRKNAKHFRKWAKARGLGCFRVYDRDIPEFPYAVDVYGTAVVLVEYPRRNARSRGSVEDERTAALDVVTRVMEVPAERVFTKTHLPMPWGQTQYGRLDASRTVWETVEENGLKFRVNLTDYLDVGLFMDHRDTRQRVRGEARGKRVLNLFCYTGAFTVYAAAGGAAATVSVDLSNTYLDWAEENLTLNGLADARHRLVRADATAWLQASAEDGAERFDVIVLDPPSQSVSKRMDRGFNVQRDQRKLLLHARALLSPGGALYFSTNFKGFELDPRGVEGAQVQELTPGSLPEDFQRKDIHRCWRITG